MTEAESIGRQFFEAQDRLRGGLDRDLCAIDYTADINGNQLDFDEHQRFAAALYSGFPDLHHEFDRVDVREAAERVRFRLIGTHSGDFMGIAATGKSIEVAVDTILMIEEGKIETLIGSFDQGDLMRQLGVA